MMMIYCTGESSYDAHEMLPFGVFSTLEKAMASVELSPGEVWEYDGDNEWRTRCPGRHSTAEVPLIRRYDLDAESAGTQTTYVTP